MTILSGDIKILASQVMDDVENGGGAPTSTVILDGTSNSVFNDISELDRAGGRVSLRKLFATVQTDNRDTYLGAHVVVADQFDDPRVTATIFTTRNTFDTREDACDRVEAYLYKAGLTDGYLLENHIQGQRAIQLFARTGAVEPTVGDTLCLVVGEGQAGEVSQYVRVTKVTSQIRTFTDTVVGTLTDYQAKVVTLSISDALRNDFPGSPPSRLYQYSANKTKVRETMVADAAQYFGASKLTAPVSIGDIEATVDSVFSQIVPSAQTDTILSDRNACGEVQSVMPVGSTKMEAGFLSGPSAGKVFYCPRGIYPGSLEAYFVGGVTMTDTAGVLYDNGTPVADISYEMGTVTFRTGISPYVGNLYFRFTVAAFIINNAATYRTNVTLSSRSLSYVETLMPIPSPGTLRVSYLSQGKWYDLIDDGSGALRGSQSSFGAGTVSRVTGTVSLTLGALPDVGSAILYSWGSPATTYDRTSTFPAKAYNVFQMDNPNAGKGNMSFTLGGLTYTDDGLGKIKEGTTVVGSIDYKTGRVKVATPNTLAPGAQAVCTYSWGAPLITTEPSPVLNGSNQVTFTIEAGLLPRSVELSWKVEATKTSNNGFAPPLVISGSGNLSCRDDGAGGLVMANGVVVGSINYTTGDVILYPNQVITIHGMGYTGSKLGQGLSFQAGVVIAHTTAVTYTMTGTFVNGSSVGIEYRKVNAPNTATETHTITSMAFSMLSNSGETLVPGSICFSAFDSTYIDRNGYLYRVDSVMTGAVTQVGTVSYSTGEVIFTSLPTSGYVCTLTPRSMATYATLNAGITTASFRIPVAPVRPQSVQLIATKTTGGSISVTSDAVGNFTHADMFGFVDYSTGVVTVFFGAMVNPAPYTGESWYDPTTLVGGKLYIPKYVLADTIKFNAVGYTYLPLDASLIGIDPVRLPQDGRVSIFRPGSYAVLGHSVKMSPQTVTNGQTVNCGRVRLSRIRVFDSNNVVITTGYTQDLDAGTITFNAVGSYSQPITIEHRVEDMAQVTDAEISGALKFSGAISHDYPPGSVVSSALVAGDLHARVSIIFDQGTWGSIWSDTAGASATASYNDVAHPIEVTNVGAQTERWALVFTNTTTFNVVGEHVGVIATGTTASDLAPLNPATGAPYFTLRALGWGSGWSAGNVLRFNTVGAEFPFWVIRTVQQGPETVINDSFTILVRGDVDRP